MRPQFYIVFDGPPGPESGRFVEVETLPGISIAVGKWMQRDCWWLLGPFQEASNDGELLSSANRALAEQLKNNNSLRAQVVALTDLLIASERRFMSFRDPTKAEEQAMSAAAETQSEIKQLAADNAVMWEALTDIAQGNVSKHVPGFINFDRTSQETKGEFQERFATWMQEFARNTLGKIGYGPAPDKSADVATL